MKKNIITNSLAMAAIIASGNVFADNNTTNFQANAEVENSCVVTSAEINFGVISAPLSQQGSSGAMSVICTKGTPYSIDLSYGGVYGQGTHHADTVTSSYNKSEANGYSYKLTSHRDGDIGIVYCQNNKQVSFANISTAQKFGYNTTAMVDDVNNFCSVGASPPSVISIGSMPYEFGMMQGSVRGDGLAYQITIPGDINKVWNSGKNAYTSVGTGQIQDIEVNAKIVPGSSSSTHVAQDGYNDTVTARIDY